MLRAVFGAIGLLLLGLAIFPLQMAFALAAEGLGIVKYGQFLILAAVPLSVSALLLWKATSGWVRSVRD
jgi:hypothetical protein